jgi:hypothetical protein
VSRSGIFPDAREDMNYLFRKRATFEENEVDII